MEETKYILQHLASLPRRIPCFACSLLAVHYDPWT